MMDFDSDTLYLRSLSGENNAPSGAFSSANPNNNNNNTSNMLAGVGGPILSSSSAAAAAAAAAAVAPNRSFTNYTRDYRLSDDKYNSLMNSLDDKYPNSFDTTSKPTSYQQPLLSSSSYFTSTSFTKPTTTTISSTSTTTATNNYSSGGSYLKRPLLSSSMNNASALTSTLPLSSTSATRTNNNNNSQPPLYSSIDSAAIDKLISSSNHHHNARYGPTHHHQQQPDHLLLSSTSLLAGGSSRANFGTTNSTTRDYLLREPSGVTTTASTSTSTTTTTTTTTTTGQPLSYLNQQNSSINKQQQLSSDMMMNHPTSTNTGGQNILQQLFDDMRQIEDVVDSIEIPARGRCRVFMAKYGYDPFKQSPNDNPDAELAFNAGDYIMVFDDIDEDGYFIGELMDGRRGYVPSNWLDRLVGDDLFEFQATTLYKQAMGTSVGGGSLVGASKGGATGGDADELDSQSYPPEFYDALITDTMNHSNFQHLLAPEDYHRMNDYVDLDDVDEVDDECLSDYERAEAEQMRRAVPPPQRLVVEKLLNKSILISWLHPQSARGTIVSYQVFVDGVSKQTIPSGDRTKALLDGVDSNIPHRVSVRAIDLHGRHSNDAGCTIVIGQNIPFAPSCVKASHITSDSALISWLPCNSNFHHVVAVNSVEVQTVRPGVYKHLINGLSANTLYRVWVRAKPGKILSVDEKNPKKLESLTTYVDFKTMPKSLPDPPVNVQVEAGPQRRTLLVTWLPLTLNDFGSSNGCAVTGYAVFAGHKKLADIDSPTGDHALLDVADLESLHKKSVTVRTKSGENLSQDSMPCQIPDEYLKQAASRGIDLQAMTSHHHHHHQPHHHPHQQHQQQINTRNQQQQQQQQQRQHSPSSRHRLANQQQQQMQMQGGHQQQRPMQPGGRGYLSNRSGRQMARSLQNLESDMESRRSSIPAIEITRETSGSDIINPTESYSEEEFENSMRFKGGHHHQQQQQHRGRSAAGSSSRPGGAGGRYRARQSHSMDGSVAGGGPPGGGGHHQLQQQQMAAAAAAAHRTYQSQANLSIAAANRLRGTPSDIKYFVALFDYDPSTMSPNPNAAADELAFKEGSIIKVYGSLGEDGFYKGEIDNQMGYVPCNVITEITDPNLLNSLYEKSNQQQQQQQNLGPNQMHQRQLMQQANVANLQQQQQQVTDTQQQQQQQQQQASQQGGVKRMVALYDYDPQENSPNADTESEIPFKIDDVIYVYGKMDTDGFYMGEVERTKQRGLVPSNFLREDPLPMAAGRQPAQPLIGANNQQMMMTTANQPGQPMTQNVSVPQQQQQQPTMDMNALRMPIQQQQQQPLVGHQNQLRGANLRGPLPVQQQQQQQQPPQQGMPMMAVVDPQQPHNINRPTTLSLNNQQLQQQQQQQQNAVQQLHNQQQMAVNSMGGQMQPQQQQQQPGNLNMQQGANRMMPIQQQQHQQPGNLQQQIQNNNNNNNSLQMAMNNQQMGNQQQRSFGLGTNSMQQQQPMTSTGAAATTTNPMQQMNALQQQQHQLQQQQLQQQQQQQGGVLSNLLSSGKQIIGAATTPRIPNQPGHFPNPTSMTMMGHQNMQQQPQDMAAGGGNFQVPRANLIRGPLNSGGPAAAAMSAFNNAANQQQQQQPGNFGGHNMGDHLAHNQPPSMAHNSFVSMAGNAGANLMGQQQQQHPQHQQYNQMGGFNRPANAMAPQGAMGGEEPGGNILNTVKNMFKL